MMGFSSSPGTAQPLLWQALGYGLACGAARQHCDSNVPSSKGYGRWSLALIAIVLTSAASLSLAQTAPATAPAQPEATSATQAKPGWATSKFSVATAHPLATAAGHQVLRAGGSALDAAIAVQIVLGLDAYWLARSAAKKRGRA